MDFDIVVIGGGIAGLSAAREISQNCSANIAVIEEHSETGLPAVSSAFTFSETIKKAKEMEAVAMHISVLPENVIAQNFYRKNGINWEIKMFEIKLK